MELLVFLKKLQVGTTTDQRVLWFDLILNNQSLALVVNLLGKLGRDGVVGSRVFHNKTLVTLNSLEDSRLLDSPLTNVGPFLV